LAESPAGERPLHGALTFLLGLTLLVVLNMGGEWLVRVTRVPVPGSVAGMLALTALLESGLLPLRLVRSAGELLVRHLALLYVPAGVALIAYVGVLRQGLLAITVAALASLVAVLVVVGVVVERLSRDP
jgi:holin-like protein